MRDDLFLTKKGFAPIRKHAILSPQKWDSLMVRHYDYICLSVFACPKTKVAFYVEFPDEATLHEFKQGQKQITFFNLPPHQGVVKVERQDLLTERESYKHKTFKQRFAEVFDRLIAAKIDLVF